MKAKSALLFAACATALAPAAPPAFAQELGAEHVRIVASGEGPAARSFTLGVGKAAIVDLPTDARDVLLSDPEVADAVVRTARRLYLIGRKLGQTNVFLFDEGGRQIALLEVRVEPDVGPLNDLIRRLAPEARARAEAVNGAFVLTGTVRDAAEADRVVQLARRFAMSVRPEGAGGEPGDEIVNLLSIEGREQVLVKVRVVEMSRTLVKQLGVNLNVDNIVNRFLSEDVFVDVATSNGYSIAGKALGGLGADVGWVENELVPESLSYGNAADLDYARAGSIDPSNAGTGGFAVDGDTGDVTLGPGEIETRNQVDASIDAFERAGLLRVLAEPNLTAVSGEAARFLAGGEFPVPISSENGDLTIDFKPYGVGLSFTPVVLSAGRISLKLATEVSELTADGAISTGDTTANDNGRLVVIRGITVPALQVRRAETTVEMPSGGALVIAGLIQERTRAAIEGLPGAKDMPVFGALFRSRDFQNSETELVIIVTPYLVKSTDPDTLRTPADGFANASDLEAIFSGRLNAAFTTPSSDTAGRRLSGPVGFVLPETPTPITHAASKGKGAAP